ncbi:hypothetical protein FQR65_LT06746 [Abscondita terminalis]|nr:hypothetical protein FQR65_LT06746 [Abscondita terminalis]
MFLKKSDITKTVTGVNLQLGSIAFIVIGVLVKVGLNDVVKVFEKLDVDLTIAPILMIVVGSIVLVISFFGCCGAIKENTCMLTTYAVILLALLIAQVAIGIYAFIQTKDSKINNNDVAKIVKEMMEKYDNPNDPTKEVVDLFQKELQCCGADGSSDWANWGKPIPPSCCEESSGSACTTPFKDGCSKDIYDFLIKSAKIVGIVIITIGAVELVGAIVALCLASSLRNNERRGIAFIAVGAVYVLNIESFTITLNKTGIPFSLAPALLLTIGIVVFLIAFFGCCGAIKESSCLLITYAVILIILFLLQVSIGVYAFLQFKQSNNSERFSIEQGLTETMNLYDHNEQARETFDTLQSQLKCCGVKGPKDWNRIKVGDSVPSSCCDNRPAKCYPSSAYWTGCSELLYKFLRDTIVIIGIVFIVIALIEVLGGTLILFSPSLLYYMSKTIAVIADFSYSFLLVPSAFLSVGIVLVCIGTVGLFGAYVNSKILLTTYLIAVSILFVCHVGVGIYAKHEFSHNNKETLMRGMRKLLLTTISDYHTSQTAKRNIDYVQQAFLCCGADGPYDYHGRVPDSCCKDDVSCDATNVFTRGCLYDVYDFVQNKIVTIALMFSVAELFAIATSYLLILL